MRSAALILAFAASAFAYSVTTPSQTQGWTNSGAQPLIWSRVDTDPSNFTVVLTNQDRSVMPINNQVLNALVNGTVGSINVNPPSGGWPTGHGFQVNLVKDPNSLDSILAQSTQFSITASTTSGSASFTNTQSTLTVATTPTTPTAVTDTSTGTSTNLNPTATKNAALPTVGTNPVFMGAIALLGALFA